MSIEDIIKKMDPADVKRLLGLRGGAEKSPEKSSGSAKTAVNVAVPPSAPATALPNGAPTSSIKATPLKPETVDSELVWKYFLESVIREIRERVKDNSLLPVFLLENPYPSYSSAILDVLKKSDLDGYKFIDTEGRSNTNFAKLVEILADDQPKGIVLFCTSRSQVPREFRSIIRQDGYLTIPALTIERLQEFAKRYRSAIELSQSAKEWGKWIGPQELIVANTLSPANWESGLKQLAEQRLGAQLVGKPRKLDELYGVDAAKHWARQLFNDIALARTGSIGWGEVDRGALLAGPPGTGKTTLAKAIASEAGTNFLAISPAKDWMTGNGLDESVKLMSATFSAARQQAPSILFIDEIDTMGSRENFSGQNASWNTAFLNALLTELDGFEDRDQVIVIGATNLPNDVDPALRRAGRLDRLIRVDYPNLDALAAMYQGMLKNYPHSLNEAAIRECAASSLGLTGADVEVLVRGARRRARLNNNSPISKDDVYNEIFNIPPDAERRPMNKDELLNTAYHEAGHATVGLLLPTLRDKVRMASIIPNNDGALGFVAFTPTENNETRSSLLDRICMALAGRAAEELVFQHDQVTTGAGGQSRKNDLAVARRLAEAYVGIYGFSDAHPNWWAEVGGAEEAQSVVTTQFKRASALLSTNKAKFDKLANALLNEFVLPREKMLALMELEHG